MTEDPLVQVDLEHFGTPAEVEARWRLGQLRLLILQDRTQSPEAIQLGLGHLQESRLLGTTEWTDGASLSTRPVFEVLGRYRGLKIDFGETALRLHAGLVCSNGGRAHGGSVNLLPTVGMRVRFSNFRREAESGKFCASWHVTD